MLLRRGALALTLIWTSTLGFYGWQTWRSAERATLNNLSSMVHIGQAALSVYLSNIHAHLAEFARDVELREPAHRIASAFSLVRTIQSHHPELVEVVWVDPSGKLLATSLAQPGDELPTMEQDAGFQEFLTRAGSGTTFDVGRPVKSAATGQWSAPLRYVVPDAAGQPAGYLEARTPLSFIHSYWDHAEVVEDVAFGLIGPDGYLRSRYPLTRGQSEDDAFGKPRTGTLIDHLRSNHQSWRGHVYGLCCLDGSRVLDVYERMDKYPLTFFAVLPQGQLASAWWSSFQAPLLLTLLFTVLGSGTFRYVRQKQIAWLSDQAALYKTSSELAAIVNSSQDAIVSTDKHGECLAWNPAAVALLGYSDEEACKMSMVQIVPRHLRKSYRYYLEQELQGIFMPVHRSQRICKDGRVLDVEVATSAVRNAQGERVAVAQIIRDITPRLALEDMARQSDRVLASISEGVLISDADRRMTRMNPAFEAITGFGAEIVLGSTCSFLQGPDTDPAEIAAIRRCLDERTVYRGLILNYRKDGTTFWNSLTITPMMDENGALEHYVGVVRDATALHQAKLAQERLAQDVRDLSARLMRAQELERRHLALELHDELGQGLTAIKIGLQLRGRVDASEQEVLDAQTLATVERTIAQVRALSLELRPSVLDDLGVAAALEWLVAQRRATGGVDIALRVERSGERMAAEVETAAFRIAQEALTNALRHARAKRVEILLDGDSQTLTLQVTDDGAGFDAAAVLQGGSQLGKSLGLIGMHERALLAGGTLRVESQAGAGCRVEFSCPLQPSVPQ